MLNDKLRGHHTFSYVAYTLHDRAGTLASYNNIRKQKILILVHLYYDALFIYSAQSVDFKFVHTYKIPNICNCIIIDLLVAVHT